MGEALHTDVKGPFKADVMGFKYFLVLVNEASPKKRVPGLRSRDAVVDATVQYIDEMAREGVAVKTFPGDGAGKVGRSVNS